VRFADARHSAGWSVMAVLFEVDAALARAGPGDGADVRTPSFIPANGMQASAARRRRSLCLLTRPGHSPALRPDVLTSYPWSARRTGFGSTRG